MKRLLVAFVIFVAANTNIVSSYTQAEFEAIGKDLFRKTIKSVNHLNNIQLLTIGLEKNILKMKNSFDFDIPKNPQILQLEDEIDKCRSNKNIHICDALKNTKVAILIDESRKELTQKINTQIEKYRITLTGIHKTLQKIFDSLNDGNLKNEIKLCIRVPEECRLTDRFPSDISNGEEIMTSMDNVLKNIIEMVIEGAINPKLPYRIDNDIFKPVQHCINTISV